MKWAGALVLVLGCTNHQQTAGDAGPDAGSGGSTEPVSGSRLKLAWFELGDGTRIPAGGTDVVDAELATACTPHPWSDQVTRCTPEITTISYADAACTMPVAPLDGKQFAVTTVGDVGPSSCGAIYDHLFQALATTRTLSQFYLRDANGCAPTVPLPHPILVTDVEEASPSRFVVVRQEDRGAGPLAVRMWLGEDGLVDPVALVDVGHGVTCDSHLERATSVPCLPVETVQPYELVYADTQCAQPVQVEAPNNASCEPPPLASLPTYGCPLYYNATPYSGALYGEQATCANASPPRDDAYLLGAPVDLVPLTRGPAEGTSAVVPVEITNGTTRFADPRVGFVSQLASECFFDLSVRDGETATCRPWIFAGGIAGFSDPACTQALPPLVGGGKVSGCGERAAEHYVAYLGGVYRIGAPHLDPVYTLSGSTCLASVGAAYELGEVVATDQLPTAVKRRDP